ncbi:heme ABC transporter substrate-binding protein IsdE [Eubacterium oxidoreducens]|nr:heme ABC transporter substrate-binding protein IsdE [Eubacterium oxidoreducens]
MSKGNIKVAGLVLGMVFLTACSGKSGQKVSTAEEISITTAEESGDYSEGVKLAKEKVEEKDGEVNIISTSPAVTEICEKLNLSLVGVAESSLYEIPEVYEDVTTVGTSMSPDMEIIGSLNPDWILSPLSLQSDLEPKYEELDTDWAFVNVNSLQGMYTSILELGYIFDREKEAEALVKDYEDFLESYQAKNDDEESPKVLILMGLPGSYVIATPESYVGNLVEIAGGENVYEGEEDAFISVNTEDMKTKEPDVILLAAHALPDEVSEMFEEEFATNDIWQHFEAVQNNQVYELTYDYFGMSANFEYQNALEELQGYLYSNEE